jgi:hypothetical protein
MKYQTLRSYQPGLMAKKSTLSLSPKNADQLYK